MKLSLIALGTFLSVSALACAPDESGAPASATEDVTSGKVTLKGSASSGLRADLQKALGEAASADAASLTNTIKVTGSTSSDYLEINDTSWRMELDASTKSVSISFPDDYENQRTAKKLFDAMRKGSKETIEGEFGDVVRRSPGGRVVCTKFADIDGNTGSTECTITGVTTAGNG